MNKKNLMNADHLEWKDDIERWLKKFPVYVTTQRIQGTNMHTQVGLEIHITNEGHGTMVVGRQNMVQFPGSVLVFRGKVPHRLSSKTPYKRTVICIAEAEAPSDWMGGNLMRLIDFSWIPEDSCLSFHLGPKQCMELEKMCADMKEELRNQSAGWERKVLAHVLLITVFLQRSADNEGKSSAHKQTMITNSQEIVQQCIDYVCEHLDEKLTLKEISKRFSISQEYLTRIFTRELGVSFYQYVLLQRITEGKRLLREKPNLNISDIAYLIGFLSASHFNRHFKALTGTTPTKYRKQFTENRI
ncbi:AraC family transcriptional regulator [Paenibacillus silviterrae]|uniref:AraC family transcriptional regulator n=1 Tax=Paenibacillus silviterrae TaxID=3242194 RepID=UPI0025436A65|nr:AraC family transcriptional regulator [Paenibacillus chinjuensis]